jgi:membrane-associated PAP2 superfamily phosphatase
VLVLLTASVTIRHWNIDLLLQAHLWSGDGGWRYAGLWWVSALYQHGSLAGLAAGLLAALTWVGSFALPALQPARLISAYLLLVLLLGPGLLVNGALKGHWGRHRPREVVQFGGGEEFQPLGAGSLNGDGKSFPSGHASMGFLWFAPAVCLWRSRRRMAVGMSALALLHGGVMGAARMAQGAHWLSDIVWSAGIVYGSSWFLWRVMSLARSGPVRSRGFEPLDIRRRGITSPSRAATLE